MQLFKNRRAKVFFRDGYVCQAHRVGLPRCGYRAPPGTHKGLTTHHLVEGSERIDDQLTLCSPCHKVVNRKEVDDRRKEERREEARACQS